MEVSTLPVFVYNSFIDPMRRQRETDTDLSGKAETAYRIDNGTL